MSDGIAFPPTFSGLAVTGVLRSSCSVLLFISVCRSPKFPVVVGGVSTPPVVASAASILVGSFDAAPALGIVVGAWNGVCCEAEGKLGACLFPGVLGSGVRDLLGTLFPGGFKMISYNGDVSVPLMLITGSSPFFTLFLQSSIMRLGISHEHSKLNHI